MTSESRDNLSFTQQLREDGLIITDVTTKIENKDENTENTKELPILLIPNTILLPHTDIKIPLDKVHTENILNTINDDHQGIILTPKKLPRDNNGGVEFYDVGVILEIKNIEEEAKQYRIELKVKDKVEIKGIKEKNSYFYAKYETIQEDNTITPEESKTINKDINDAILSISKLIPNSEPYARRIIDKIDTEEKIAEVFPYLRVTINKKQELLELNSVKIRALRVIQLLLEQRDAMSIQMEITNKLNKNMSEIHKQTLLREQMKMIQEELNMTDDTEDRKTYRERIKEAELPEEVEKAALEEVDKLERQGQNNSEENIIRNNLDTILQLPWHKEEKKDIDITKAREQLDKDHYGLEKVKDRIIQHLTVLKMKNEKQGSIILFVGPPGTGKTSLGKSIAKALDRPYVRVSLGGIKDESEIRGHRRTYLGALPG